MSSWDPTEMKDIWIKWIKDYVNKDVEKGREALLKLFNFNSYLRKSLLKRSTFPPSPNTKSLICFGQSFERP